MKKYIEELFALEGSPTLDGQPYPEDNIEVIVGKFFVDGQRPKRPPTNRADATVKMLHGAVGSGKSFNAAEDYKNLPSELKSRTIYVSYDETGAIYEIPGFKEEIAEIIGGDFEQHGEINFSTLSSEQYAAVEAVWTKYQALSQHIRSRILQRAVAEGYNLIIDSTSSSSSAVTMIENLQKIGYDQSNIEVESTYAPIDISRSRMEKRPRKASYKELITKRVGDPEQHKGALNMIEPLIAAAGRFVYRYNPDNDNLPQEAFVFENGRLKRSDATVIRAICDDVVQDNQYIQDLIPMVAEGFPEFAEPLEGYEALSSLTCEKFERFLTTDILRSYIRPRAIFVPEQP